MKVFRALARWRVPDLFAKAIPARNSVQRGDFRFRSRKSPSLEPSSGCLENLSTTLSSHADEARRLETSARSIPVKSVPQLQGWVRQSPRDSLAPNSLYAVSSLTVFTSA